jgi:hypothetical protein
VPLSSESGSPRRVVTRGGRMCCTKDMASHPRRRESFISILNDIKHTIKNILCF